MERLPIPPYSRLVECDCGLIADARCRQWDNRFGYSGWLLEAHFDGYQVAPFEQGAADRQCALAAVRDWLERVKENQPDGVWLVLVGGFGTGKTHLAAAAAGDLRASRVPVAFANVPYLLDWLRSTFRPDSETTFDDNFDAIKTAPVLVLDDLGAQSATAWANEKLYEIINQRSLSRQPLLVTTNAPLHHHEPRIASRLADKRLSTVVDCGYFDWRQVER